MSERLSVDNGNEQLISFISFSAADQAFGGHPKLGQGSEDLGQHRSYSRLPDRPAAGEEAIGRVSPAGPCFLWLLQWPWTLLASPHPSGWLQHMCTGQVITTDWTTAASCLEHDNYFAGSNAEEDTGI